MRAHDVGLFLCPVGMYQTNVSLLAALWHALAPDLYTQAASPS